jgi:hypothetical protein
VTSIDYPGDLEHSVSQRRFPVVDVGDDAKIANNRRVSRPRAGGSIVCAHGGD